MSQETRTKGRNLFILFSLIILLSLLLSIFVLGSLPISAYSSNELKHKINAYEYTATKVNNDASSTTVDEARLKRQDVSMEQYSKTLEFFNQHQVSDDSLNNSPFPSYYAGSYLDNSGDLVIMITDESPQIKQELKKASKNTGLKFKLVKYSYNNLTDILNAIDSGIKNNITRKKTNVNIPDELDIFNYISGTVLLDEQNIIEIYIKNLDDSKIKLFKKHFTDGDMFVFKEAAEVTTEGGSACPGAQIENMYYSITLGFRVRRTLSNGVVESGFLTCGHNLNYGDNIYDALGNLLGTVTLNINEGMTDISFVKYSSGSYVSNNIYESLYNTLNTTIEIPVVNTYVYKFGAQSFKTGGYIRSTRVSFTDPTNGKYYYSLVATDYDSEEGDSGALVASGYQSFNTMGIHRGRYGNYAVFSSYSNFYKQLSLYRY